MKVQEVRALRSDAYVLPNEAERKIYLFQRAESLNASGQNALLKLLEEGPSYGVYFFLTPNPEALLETLRSRCELLWCSGDTEAEQGQEAKELAAFLLGQGDSVAALRF